MERLSWAAIAVVALAVASACGGAGEGAVERPALVTTTVSEDPVEDLSTTVTTTPLTTTTEPPSTAAPRPEWLGTRVLQPGPDGLVPAQPTPPELVDRRLETPDHLPPPATQAFQAEVSEVPDDVLARSTWRTECPVPREELRYLLVTFWGFDGEVHTGELLLRADAVDAVVAGFAHLHELRFPIEEMRVVEPWELDAPPTGDGNNTTAFVCRPTRGSSTWSEHAQGRAVDINPFHNPYVKGDLVLPELATAYVDRTDLRPGMLTVDDVAGFTGAGWGWGGHWRSLKDHMHVSANDR